MSGINRWLVRRQEGELPTCGTGEGSADYNLNFHIGSIFIILAVSASAAAFPVLVAKVPKLKIPHNFLFGVRHFGTGVLIATAFVHLLPTAFISLTDPCLPAFWNDTYPAMAGVIAMSATFGIVLIEMALSGRHSCAFPAEMMSPNPQIVSPRITMTSSPRFNITGSPRFGNNDNLKPQAHNSIMAVLDPEARPNTGKSEDSQKTLTASQETSKALLQVCLLECGILFHSVFIGMALAVALGNEFVILLVAISFHQTFEGLALGSRIATIDWANHPRGSYQPWLMALAYGCTTPIGQAIGIATHSLYDPASQTGLLMVGVMNSISSGLLIFAALVELLSEDFLSDRSWEILRGKRRIIACVLVFGGAFGMSLIGAWA